MTSNYGARNNIVLLSMLLLLGKAFKTPIRRVTGSKQSFENAAKRSNPFSVLQSGLVFQSRRSKWCSTNQPLEVVRGGRSSTKCDAALSLEPSTTPDFHTNVAIQQHSRDQRVFRTIELKNGLKVLLISDTDSETAAASVCIHTGHFSDPPTMPGLAHFHEHMLFLGCLDKSFFF